MTPSLPPVRRFALLIGVNHYPSVEGGDLRAPVNEVKAWFAFLRRLGVDPAHIQVLTSPGLTPAELGGDPDAAPSLGSATTAAVNDAVRTLRERLAEAGEGAVGLVVFVGHGDLSCPVNTVLLSDYAGTPLDADWPEENSVAHAGRLNSVNLEKALARRTSEPAYEADMTCVWDTCRRLQPGAGGIANVRPADTVELYASKAGQSAFERCFGGEWRAEFSWAALTVLEQWPIWRRSDTTPYVAIDGQTLAAKAGALVAVFEGEQTSYACTGKSAAPFLMPMTDTSPVSPVASAGVEEEFPSGTTDFWTGSDTNGTMFLRITRQSGGNQLTYWIRSDFDDSGRVKWPDGFYAKYTWPTVQPKPPDGHSAGGIEIINFPFTGYTYTSTPVGNPPSDVTGPFGTVATMWSTDARFIQMAQDATNKRDIWRHAVDVNSSTGYGSPGEDAMFDPQNTAHQDAVMKKNNGNGLPNSPPTTWGWKYWTDTRN